MTDKPTIGIGILSWKAHQTLRASLDTYRDNGFLSFFDEKLIYFSDMSDIDTAIAQIYGWNAVGGPNNGIAGGMRALAENLYTDYILLLQNDNPIIENAAFAMDHLQKAITLLETKQADLVRMRHRWQVGEGFADVRKYLEFFPATDVDDAFIAKEHNVADSQYSDTIIKKMRRTFRPLKASRLTGRSIFIEKNPHQLFPSTIQNKGDFLIIDSSVIHFTDQCLLISRDFFLNTLMTYADAHPSSRTPNGFQAPEICINGSWWRNQHYKIAQGRGIFTHARADGSFRIEHPAYEENKA